jgi:hypothetical protein
MGTGSGDLFPISFHTFGPCSCLGLGFDTRVTSRTGVTAFLGSLIISADAARHLIQSKPLKAWGDIHCIGGAGTISGTGSGTSGTGYRRPRPAKQDKIVVRDTEHALV